MNPFTATILTILQIGGYLAIVTYLALLLTWAIRSCIREYWAGKTTCLSMTREHAPDIKTMSKDYMSAKNNKTPVV